VTDQVSELGGFTLAFHEQHTFELERGWVVEVLSTRERAQRRFVTRDDSRPPVGERMEGTGVTLESDGEFTGRCCVELLVLMEPGQVQDRVEQR
jgi:hypothetical protein